MTNVSKCLAVFATVFSFAFLAVAALSYIGGPNYEGELDAPVFDDYTFTKDVDGATGKLVYKAESRLRRPTGDQPNAEYQTKVIAQDEAVLPKVLIQTLRDKKQQQTDEMKELDDLITDVEAQIALAKKAMEVDRAAMESRIAGLEKQLTNANQALLDVKEEINKTQLDEVKTLNRAERRRQDINRIRTQIEIARADKERLDAQERKLTVQIEELDGDLHLLKERNQLLNKRLPQSTTATEP